MNNKTSYQYLQEFCQIKSRSSFSRQENPITPRVQYLIDELKKLELNYEFEHMTNLELLNYLLLSSETKHFPPDWVDGVIRECVKRKLVELNHEDDIIDNN